MQNEPSVSGLFRGVSFLPISKPKSRASRSTLCHEKLALLDDLDLAHSASELLYELSVPDLDTESLSSELDSIISQESASLPSMSSEPFAHSIESFKVEPSFCDWESTTLSVSEASIDSLVAPFKHALQDKDHVTDTSTSPAFENDACTPPPAECVPCTGPSHNFPHVHSTPPYDTHYPYALTRKANTCMTSGVCVWCVASELMELPGRPKLQTRINGNNADWGRLLRTATPWWAALVRNVAPNNALFRVDAKLVRTQYAKDLAGALIEMLLRELRGGFVPQRDLMAQVRSAKYHKSKRFADAILQAYAWSL